MSAGSVLSSRAAGILPVVMSLGRWSALGPEIALAGAGAASSAAWFGTRQIIYVPVDIPIQVPIIQVGWLNGATVGTNNAQCGVYSSVNNLPASKLIACASTLSAGANVMQWVTVTTTIIGPGRYFLALTFDGTTATIYRIANTVGFHKGVGQCEETPGVFGLPTTATPVVMSGARCPEFGFATQTTV